MAEHNALHTPVVKNAQRIVVKVGSSLVTNEGRGLDEQAIAQWSEQLAALVAQGRELIMVSSGAVAEGMKRLGWTTRPKEIHELQAAAAVGQMGLVQMYETKLRACGVGSAQVLLTHADLADRERYLNARSTLLTLLSLGVVPVINENDTVVNDEIKFGDNDTLGALVANLVEADVLIILTDQPGLYSEDPRKNPNARFIHEARAGDPSLESHGRWRRFGHRQGRHDHQNFGRQARRWFGCLHRHRLGPRAAECCERLCEGEAIGTCLVAQTAKSQARKRWMSDHLQMRGSVWVDAGAVPKLVGEGKSLLPVGMTAVHGEFSRGDVIAVCGPDGQEVARGLANYGSTEARLICRKGSSDFERLLGYVGEPEMIHRDNLVLTRG